MYVNAYLLPMRMTFSVCHSYQVSSQQETGHLYFRAWNPVACLPCSTSLGIGVGTSGFKLASQVSNYHSTTTELTYNCQENSYWTKGRACGKIFGFKFQTFPWGKKTGKQNKKYKLVVLFFSSWIFQVVEVFSGDFFWEVVKIWPKKNGGFSASPLQPTFPFLGGLA